MYQLILFGLLSASFSLIGQEQLLTVKDSLSVVMIQEDRINLLEKIADDYRGGDQLNRDSLRKYNDLIFEIIGTDGHTDVHQRTMERNLIAEYRRPFDQYEILALQLIQSYRSRQQPLKALKELYYLAKKAQTAGLTKSFSLYEQGLEDLSVLEGTVDTKQYCKLESLFMTGYATCHDYHGIYDKALEYANMAVLNAEACQDSSVMLSCYRSIGAIIGRYMTKTSFDSTLLQELDKNLLDYLRLTYDLAKRLDHTTIYPLASYNLAFYYYDIDSLNKSLKYANESLISPVIEWLPMQRYYSQMLLSDIYWHMGQKQESFEYLMSGVQSATDTHETRHNFMAQLDIAEWHYRNEEFNPALLALNSVDGLMVDNLEMQINYNRKKHLVHKALGNYQEAYTYSERHAMLKDSMRQQEVSTQISTLLEQKNKAERSEEIAMLKADSLKYQLRSRTILFASLAFVLMLVVIASLLYMKNRKKIAESEKAILQIEQRLFRSQMNPHFIFNTLGSIQSFLLDKNKSKEAAYYIAKFSKLMRQILSQSQRSAIPLQEELDTLNNYLLLQKMRFQDKFNYHIEIDESVHIEDINIPPMLLQPVVENAIEHGKVHLISDGMIQVAFKMKNDLLQVEVSDNGVGVKSQQSANAVKDKESVALQIIKERLSFLSNKFDQNINLIFGKPKLGKGTTVIFNLPSL